MKKIIAFVFLVGLVIPVIVANPLPPATKIDSFTIKGSIGGLKDGSVVYLIQNSSKDTINTSTVAGGVFTLSGKVPSGTEYYYLRVDTSISKKRSQEFLLVNGVLSLTGEISRWPTIELVGSDPHNDFKSFVALWENLSHPITNTKKALLEVTKQINQAKRNADGKEVTLLELKKDSIEKTIPLREKDRLAGVKRFIETHKYSVYVPDIIRRMEGSFSNKERETMYEHLTDQARQSYFGSLLKADLDLAKVRSLVKAGVIIPHFTVSPIGQQEKSIMAIAAKNKLTLIDFWASWCKPCREQIPNLKKVYAAFHEKGFEILGIALNDREPDWKKALKKEAMPWLNARDADLHIGKTFHVPAIPGYLLIDQNGKLISFYCSGSEIPSFGPTIKGESLLNTVDSLLKKM